MCARPLINNKILVFFLLQRCNALIPPSAGLAASLNFPAEKRHMKWYSSCPYSGSCFPEREEFASRMPCSSEHKDQLTRGKSRNSKGAREGKLKRSLKLLAHKKREGGCWAWRRADMPWYYAFSGVRGETTTVLLCAELSSFNWSEARVGTEKMRRSERKAIKRAWKFNRS